MLKRNGSNYLTEAERERLIRVAEQTIRDYPVTFDLLERVIERTGPAAGGGEIVICLSEADVSA